MQDILVRLSAVRARYKKILLVCPRSLVSLNISSNPMAETKNYVFPPEAYPHKTNIQRHEPEAARRVVVPDPETNIVTSGLNCRAL